MLSLLLASSGTVISFGTNKVPSYQLELLFLFSSYSSTNQCPRALIIHCVHKAQIPRVRGSRRVFSCLSVVEGQIIMKSHSAFELQIIAHCFRVMWRASLIRHVSSQGLLGERGAPDPPAPLLPQRLSVVPKHPPSGSLTLSVTNYISQDAAAAVAAWNNAMSSGKHGQIKCDQRGHVYDTSRPL